MLRRALSTSLNSLTVLATLGMALYFFGAIGHRTLQIYQLKQEEVSLRQEIDILERAQVKLLAERERLQTNTDIEQIAREQLNLIKPGETAVVVLPTEAAKNRAQQASPPTQRSEAPWWQRWLDRLFRSG